MTSHRTSNGQGLTPGKGHCAAFLVKTLNLTVPLFTQLCKWVIANLMVVVTLR